MHLTPSPSSSVAAAAVARLRPSPGSLPAPVLVCAVLFAALLALVWGAIQWQQGRGSGGAGAGSGAGSAADREWHIATADAHLAVWEARAAKSREQTVTLHRRELRQVRVLLASPTASPSGPLPASLPR